MSSLFPRILFIALTYSLLSACATNIAGRSQMMLVSESTAIAASKQAYISTLKPLEKAGKIDNDPAVVKRINAITDKLVEQAKIKRPDSARWQWEVKVIDEPDTVNAWCMAGGKMAIYTGLINKLNATDDEIAQVMAHEISHALANHTAERISVAMAGNIMLSILTSGNNRLAEKAAELAITLPNSRTSESEADVIGIELAAKAGFDPYAAVTLWQKMEAVSGGGRLEFLSTHPAPKNRVKKLKSLIPKMQPYYEAAKTR